MKKYSFLISFLAFSILFVASAKAATLNIISDKDTYPIGQDIDLNIKIDSEDQGVNGVQATLQFDKTILEAVKVDKADSVFDFWLTEPTISNESGQISFVAASTKGFSGKSLQVFKVTFKLKGSGKSNLSFSDAAITAADGSGTNALSKINGLELSFVVPETVSKGPKQIIRTPEKASGLPVAPIISVPLYPDPTKWNNASSRFFVSTKLPSDIIGVAIIINKIPISSPDTSEGLFESKEFPPLTDGIYYLHARYQNQIGWGQTLHYRIAVDTNPPIQIEINSSHGTTTDEPMLNLGFKSADELSGLKRYNIKLDNESWVSTVNSTSTLGPLLPGPHSVVVRAEDNAGNATESSLKVEIIPLQAPTIDFIRERVFLGEDSLSISGTAFPQNSIFIKLKNNEDVVVREAEVKTNELGKWSYEIADSLQKDTYYFELVLSDARGAKSLPLKSPNVLVKERPIIVVAGIEITSTWFYVLLIIFLVVAFGAGWYTVRLQDKRRNIRVYMSERDVAGMLKSIRGIAEKIMRTLSGEVFDASKAHEVGFLTKRLINEIEVKEKYIMNELEDINK